MAVTLENILDSTSLPTHDLDVICRSIVAGIDDLDSMDFSIHTLDISVVDANDLLIFTVANIEGFDCDIFSILDREPKEAPMFSIAALEAND